MKFLIAPDKFKGSLTSAEVCEAISRGLDPPGTGIEIVSLPMADGGDGFASVLKRYCDTTTIYCETVDPLGRPIPASYEWEEYTKTATIELASSSGLTLLVSGERNPLKTSTYGTGMQIRHALEKGCNHVNLGIGGSATNDAGMGILAAMGFTFIDGEGRALKPLGESLSLIHRIVPPEELPSIRFTIAADVTNVLHGPSGAAYTFAMQKGASPGDVKLLDEGLKHFAQQILGQTGVDVATIPGAGAAGGIAAGLIPFFEAEIVSGIELVVKASDIENILSGVDLVITGEGKLDSQSSQGKVISAIAKLAAAKGIPCVAICGKLDLDQREIKTLGLAAAWEISPELSEEDSMLNAAAHLSQLAGTNREALIHHARHGSKIP